MAHGIRPNQRVSIPYWSQVLRALREARGITQEGWAAQLGYSRATVRRWESGQTVPSADAERAIIAICREKRLFREFQEGPLLGVTVTSDWVADQLAMARLQPDSPISPTADSGVGISIPPVYYASNGDVSLAYQAFGKGPVTFVITPGTISHRELEWENPGIRAFLLRLAKHGRVVIYDKRATGLSDRVSHGTSQDRINDLRAVMDAADCKEVILVGFTEGGPISIKFAATWPERVKALVLYGTSARAPNISPETNAESFERIQRVWGTTDSGFLEKFAPSVTFDHQEMEWWARFQRMGASPGAIRDLNAMNATLDVMSLLPDLRVPTLIIHRAGDSVTPFEEAVDMSRTIPDARLVTLEGDDHLAWAGNSQAISIAIEEFVASLTNSPVATSYLTTMMSFGHSADESPALWERLRSLTTSTPGREVRTGDHRSVLIFDSPSNAVRYAFELQGALADCNLDVGIGIHTGEVNRSSHSISGGAVGLCVAMAHHTPAGNILVTESVRHLAADPSFSFEQHSPPSRIGIAKGLELFRVRPV